MSRWRSWRDGAGRLWAALAQLPLFRAGMPQESRTDAGATPGRAKADRVLNRHRIEVAGRSGVYSVKRRDWLRHRDHIPRAVIHTEDEPGILTKAMLWEESHK